MTTREDILERLAYARALSHGPRASALIAEAVTWADALGEEDLQVATRLELTNGYKWGNEEWKALAPFVWNLARYKERPDLFDERQAWLLRWHFKEAVLTAAVNPKVAKGQVRQLEASLEEFYRAEGASMHVVHGVRASVAGLLGLEEEAAEELAAWRATPRDENTDCEACDPVRQVDFASRTEDWELAVATAAPVLDGDVGCRYQPHRMQAHTLLALLASGRPRAAWQAHLRSYRAVRDDPGYLDLIGSHLEYLALVGKVGRGLEILRRHLAWLEQAGSAGALLDALGGMSLLLREAERAGLGEEPLGAAVPAETLWSPHPAMSARTTISQAYADLSSWARQLAAAYDRRNGNTTVSDRLERTLVRAPLAAGTGGGGPAGAGGDALGAGALGERVDLVEAPEDLPDPAPTSLSTDEPADGHTVASALGIAPESEEGAGASTQDAARAGAPQAGWHPEAPADPLGEALPAAAPAGSGASASSPGQSSPGQSSSDGADQPFPLVDLVVPEPVDDGEDAVRRYADLRRVIGSSSLDYLHVADQVATRGLLPAGSSVAGLELQTGLLRAAALACRCETEEAIAERLRVRPLLEADQGPVGACYVDLLNLDDEIRADRMAEHDQQDQTDERGQRLTRATELVGRAGALVEEVVGTSTGGRHSAGVPARPRDVDRRHASRRARAAGSAQPGAEQDEEAADFLVLACLTLMTGVSVLTSLEAREEALQALEVAAAAARALPPRRRAEGTEDSLDMSRAEVLVECGDAYEGCRLAEEVMRRHERTPALLAVRGRRALGVASMRMEQFTEAVTQVREQTNIMMAAGLSTYAVNSMIPLGAALGAAERYLESAEVLETALSVAQRLGAASLTDYLHRLLAQAAAALGEHAGVSEHSLAAAEAAQAQGRAETARRHIVNAAVAAGNMGDNVQACSLFQRAASLADTTTHPGRLDRGRLLRRAARALVDDYTTAMARSRLEEAMTIMQEAKESFQPVPDGPGYSSAWEMGDWHDDMAWILWRTDENSLAVEHCEAAVAGYMATSDRESAARTLCILARLHVEQEQKEEALAACTRVRQLLAHPRWRGHEALSYVEGIEDQLR